MKLTVICCPTQGHRSQGDPQWVKTNSKLEINSHLAYLLGREGGLLELSDYFLGYAANGSRISELKDRLKQKNNILLILDGPAGKPEKSCWGEHHRMAGTFNSITLEKVKAPWAIEQESLVESITGYGWNRNIVYLMTLLNWIWGETHAKGNDNNLAQVSKFLELTPQTPEMRQAVKELRNCLQETGENGKEIDKLEKITLIGWSRGAVTAIKAANALAGNGIYKSVHDILRFHPTYQHYNIFADVPVYLFPIDPVAGPGNAETMQNKMLPGNVRSYITQIMLAEHRSGFAPQDKDIMLGPGVRNNFIYLTFPGLHESPSSIFFEGHDRFKWGTAAVGPIVYGLLYDVMSNTNPEFSNYFNQLVSVNDKTLRPPENYSFTEYILMYTHLVIYRPKYFAAKHFPKEFEIDKHLLCNQDTMYRSKVVYEKDRMIPRADYVWFPFYFINEHHRLLFKKTLPETYGLLESWFKGGKHVQAAMNEQLAKSLAGDLSVDDQSIKQLRHYIMLSIMETITEYYPRQYSWEKGNLIKNGILNMSKSTVQGKNNTLMFNDALENEAWVMFGKGKSILPNRDITNMLQDYFTPHLDPYLDYERWLHDTYRYAIMRDRWKNIDAALLKLNQAYKAIGKTTDPAALGVKLGDHYKALLHEINHRTGWFSKVTDWTNYRYNACVRLKRALLRQAEQTGYKLK